MAVGCAAVLATTATPAAAFQISTLVTGDCHESITADASAEVGWPSGPRPPTDEAVERFIDDLPFHIPASARDALGAALLIGVRFNDIRDNQPTDIPALAQIHNDPIDQPAHCIRRQEDDFGPGDETALQACGEFILRQIALALGESDDIDLTALTEVKVFLAFRGRVDVDISRYGFHMGRALHALQDSFTHAFRAPEDGRVRHVLNWVDYVRSSSYSQARDGYHHLRHLDDCSLGHEASKRRMRWAMAASRDLLAAVGDSASDRLGRLQAAQAVVDDYFAIEPGCRPQNRYCDAEEPFEPTGCRVAEPASILPVLLSLLLLAHWRPKSRTLPSVLVLSLAGQLAASWSPAAHADEGNSQPLQAEDTGEVGVYVGLGASVDRPAMAGSLAIRWNPQHRRFGLGFDAEINPWYSIAANRTAAGVVNAYATFIYRLRVLNPWELRTTAQLGTSVLLFDLVGADRGSVGIYAALSPLGVSFPLASKLRLIVVPLSVSLPVPSVRGLPFYYQQYRTTVGLEWYP